MTEEKCPYNDKECPKVYDVKSDMKEMKQDFRAMKYCMIVITVFLAMKFGTEFVELLIP